jgi:hypothetical protein
LHAKNAPNLPHHPINSPHNLFKKHDKISLKWKSCENNGSHIEQTLIKMLAASRWPSPQFLLFFFHLLFG